MSEPTRFIFPLKVMKWSTLQTENGQKLKHGGNMNAIGFIPVYAVRRLRVAESVAK